MALTRAKKTQKVETLAKELAGSTSAIVGTFAGMTVSQDFELRRKVREAGGSYRVLKNKLAARASQGTGIEGALQGLKGVSSVAYTSGDPVALAKALTAWVKDNAQFTFKLGIIDGKVITVDEVQSLATMPGKDEIFAKLLFLISAPAQRLVTVINAAGRDLAVVINQGVEKGKFAESAPAAPMPAQLKQVEDEEPASPAVATPAGESGAADAEPVAGSPVAGSSTAASSAAETSSAVEPDASAEPASQAADKPAAEGGATGAADAIEVSPAAMAAVPEAPEAEISALEEELSPAPAPAEGPAAEGSEAEAEPTQAEEAANESPVEG